MEVFKTIHEEYTSMVDTLLGGFCEDMHITPEQLVDALKHPAKNKKLSQKHRVSHIHYLSLFLHQTYNNNIFTDGLTAE